MCTWPRSYQSQESHHKTSKTIILTVLFDRQLHEKGPGNLGRTVANSLCLRLAVHGPGALRSPQGGHRTGLCGGPEDCGTTVAEGGLWQGDRTQGSDTSLPGSNPAQSLAGTCPSARWAPAASSTTEHWPHRAAQRLRELTPSKCLEQRWTPRSPQHTASTNSSHYYFHNRLIQSSENHPGRN